MKRLFLLVLVLAGLAYFGMLPFTAHDVAELLPVETVIVTRAGDRYRVDIGAGVRAVGKTLGEALDKLMEQLSGVVFYQTAEQIIVQDEAADAVEQAVRENRFRPAAGLYLTPESELDAAAVSRYLQSRSTPLTLSEARARLGRGEAVNVPRLVSVGGGYRILA